jgi:hypothetical protein
MSTHPDDLANINPPGWHHAHADGVHVWARMPGDAEADAAAQGMQETYGGTGRIRDGRLVSSYAVGDRIQWRDERGVIRRGVVVETLTDTQYHVRSHVPDVGNEHHAVSEEQTLPF